MKGTPGDAALRLLEPGGADPQPPRRGVRRRATSSWTRASARCCRAGPTGRRSRSSSSTASSSAAATSSPRCSRRASSSSLVARAPPVTGPAPRTPGEPRSSPPTSPSPSCTRTSAGGSTPRPCGSWPTSRASSSPTATTGSSPSATNVGGGTDGLDGLDRIYHLTELIQSSPEGVFRAVHGMISGGYRAQRITTHEVRFNPAKRNRGGERDLDAIVMAAVHGMDRADARVPGPRGPDPDDGPRLPARAERRDRGAGHPLPRPRRGGHRHRRPAARRQRRRPTPTPTSRRWWRAPATPAWG